MWWLLLVLAQDPPVQIPRQNQDQAQRVRAAMEESIQQQKASVQKQVEAMRQIPPPSPPRTYAATESCQPIAEPELARMIDSVAHAENVDATLVREVARQESGFHACAVSPKGAEGLMQLMPATQLSLEVRNPFDPQESLTAGAKLLKQLLDRYNGDLKLALSAYNAGPTRVDQAAGVPAILETQGYVSDILGRMVTAPQIASPAK
jgi:soluble lytic murein transglycosylase-like protein